MRPLLHQNQTIGMTTMSTTSTTTATKPKTTTIRTKTITGQRVPKIGAFTMLM